ncbi:protein NRT1/ PTR FAMILY 5.8-like [Hibiscus syriacus]|uniref:protein NRT1/ PTR FAMILY 5.8-like n=1 Tax=Hibiscus syriacus TaxID=106335 RepID=UPI001921A649|nr:protein NRT1/ PTR FAMILY 5.8-like [Hibiscus syriacus]
MSSKFLVDKVWRNEHEQYRARFARMGVGLLFASGSSLSSWLVETRRLKLIGKEEDPMTILWLAPQYALLGIANGLIEKGLTDFFYDRVPVSIAVATFLARGWIADEIDDRRFDKYLKMLAFFNIAVVPVYLFFSFTFDWSIPEKVDGRESETEDVDGREIEIKG